MLNEDIQQYNYDCLGGVYKFFIAEADQYRTWKMFLGFPFGALLGYGLFRLVISPMELPEVTRQFLGAVLIFGIAASFALFVGARCVCFLLIPTFMGAAGRSYIGTFAIFFLLQGPIENIVNNTQEITRTLACSAELSANQTMTKWQFRFAPIGNVFKDMQAEGFMLKNVGTRVNRAFSDVRAQIENKKDNAKVQAGKTIVEEKKDKKKNDGNGYISSRARDKKRGPYSEHKYRERKVDPDAQRIENEYKEKVKKQCEDVHDQGVHACWRVFENIYRRCRKILPLPIEWICHVVKFHWLCGLVKVITKAVGGECDPNRIVPKNFGTMYVNSFKMMQEMDQNVEVDIKYKVVEGKEAIDFTSAEEMRSRTMQDFKQGRKWVEFIFTLIKRVLGFTFLLVVMRAYKYYKRYVADLRFDNFYITSYFKKIDARRRFKGKKVLLPLKKIERTTHITTSSLKLQSSETKKLGGGAVLVLVRAALSGIVFFVAHTLYTLLFIIRKHSRVDFTQKGCLPDPRPVEWKYYVYVFGIYGAVLLLIIMDAYALRLRRVTASFFFRKREKQRVLYLYNMLMKKRNCFLLDMRRKVKKKAKQMKLGKRSTLMYALGRVLPFMRLCKSARGTCLICGEKENFSFAKCTTPRCNCVYCRECWEDIKEKCYACLPLTEFSSTDTDDTDSSADDEI